MAVCLFLIVSLIVRDVYSTEVSAASDWVPSSYTSYDSHITTVLPPSIVAACSVATPHWRCLAPPSVSYCPSLSRNNLCTYPQLFSPPEFVNVSAVNAGTSVLTYDWPKTSLDYSAWPKQSVLFSNFSVELSDIITEITGLCVSASPVYEQSTNFSITIYFRPAYQSDTAQVNGSFAPNGMNCHLLPTNWEMFRISQFGNLEMEIAIAFSDVEGGEISVDGLQLQGTMLPGYYCPPLSLAFPNAVVQREVCVNDVADFGVPGETIRFSCEEGYYPHPLLQDPVMLWLLGAETGFEVYEFTCGSQEDNYRLAGVWSPDATYGCLPCTVCPDGMFAASPCNYRARSDTVCGACSVCLAGQFEVVPCSPGVNRVCQECTTCGFGLQTKAGTCGGGKADTQCELDFVLVTLLVVAGLVIAGFVGIAFMIRQRAFRVHSGTTQELSVPN